MSHQPKSLKRKIFEFIWNRFKPSEESQSRLAEYLIPTVEIKTKYGNILFYCPGGRTVGRAKTLLSKEKLTIEWIEKMQKGVFWDIGANVGVYSLYASSKGMNVFSYEPSPFNFFILVKNKHLNNLKIQCFPIGFGNETKIQTFSIYDTNFGYANNSFFSKEERIQKTENKLELDTFLFSIDDLINKYGVKVPNYIKIDVDGFEKKVIKGMLHLLKKKELKEIQIEVENKEINFFNNFFSSYGFYQIREVNENSKITNLLYLRNK